MFKNNKWGGVAAALAFSLTVGGLSMSADAMNVTKAPFGKTADGTPVEIYTLTNSHGMEAKIITYGARVTYLTAPDRNGKMADVVEGFDTLEPYLHPVPFFGATIGRFGNRIAKGKFTLDGKTYSLPTNDGPNSLHGGTLGFDKRVWTAKPFEDAKGPGVEMTYVAADGEEGYPGKMTTHVYYQLTDNNALSIVYDATTDKATPVNLTNHSYFNLSGDFDKSAMDEVLMLNSDSITPIDKTLIPTGEIKPVAGTPFDFRKPTVIGTHISDKDDQLTFAGGFDHNWIINQKKPGEMTLVGVLSDPTSGRVMTTYSTEPGVQFYAGNFLDGKDPLKGGTGFKHRTAVTLETQHFPDSPNHPNFPTTIVQPGQTYHSVTVYEFSTDKK